MNLRCDSALRLPARVAAATRTALMTMACALFAPVAAGQSIFLGENALALATHERPSATSLRAAQVLHAIFDRLEVPAERREPYQYVAAARLERAKGYFEADELSETVLLAGGGVKIGFARNVLIIADGAVDIAHGAGLVVIASGSIRLSHESAHLGIRQPYGVYISKSSIELSSAIRPIVYAVKGAKSGYSGPITAYNTDVSIPTGVRVYSANRAALFLGEPIRQQGTPTMQVDSGESMPFAGERCAARGEPADQALLERMLPYVRREANCPRIDAATVNCVKRSEPTAGSGSDERWSFTLCGKTALVQVVRTTNTRSMNLLSLVDAAGKESPRTQSPGYGTPPPPRFAPPKLSETDAKRVGQLFKEALSHTVRGELIEARGKYLEVLKLAEHAGARHNLAGLDSQIERADRAAAVYTARIGAGQATARTYADRGLVYLVANDVSRGLADLDRAHAMASADAEIAALRAWGYILGNKPAQAEQFMSDAIGQSPRFAKAYEVRAWANFLQNRPAQAYKDAFSSLVEAPEWTSGSFSAHKAGYRALVGYLALRQSEPRAQAMAWLREWRGFLKAGEWPGALILFLLGEIDERDMRAVAQAQAALDRGSAEAEAVTILALDEFLGGMAGDRGRAAQDFYRSKYAAGRTLAWLINKRMYTPGEKFTARVAAAK